MNEQKAPTSTPPSTGDNTDNAHLIAVLDTFTKSLSQLTEASTLTDQRLLLLPPTTSVSNDQNQPITTEHLHIGSSQVLAPLILPRRELSLLPSDKLITHKTHSISVVTAVPIIKKICRKNLFNIDSALQTSLDENASALLNNPTPPIDVEPLKSVEPPANLAVSAKIIKPLPDILAGRYKLERILGVGGMCVVYRAFDILANHFGNPKPIVALKTFTDEFAEYPDSGLLLYSEYAITSTLNHAQIIKTFQFDVDADSERPFITLELLSGITLEQWLIENPLGVIWNKVSDMILSLTDILIYTHQQGILHGDLKPSNVMLTSDDCKLFDYGLSQALEGDLAKLPKIARERFKAWTPRYAAPELLEKAPLTKATDVFALCCIIYEILTGKNPYYQDNSGEITQAPSKPKTLSKSAWQALLTGLALNPEQRTISAEELKAAFLKKPKYFSIF